MVVVDLLGYDVLYQCPVGHAAAVAVADAGAVAGVAQRCGWAGRTPQAQILHM